MLEILEFKIECLTSFCCEKNLMLQNCNVSADFFLIYFFNEYFWKYVGKILKKRWENVRNSRIKIMCLVKFGCEKIVM